MNEPKVRGIHITTILVLLGAVVVAFAASDSTDLVIFKSFSAGEFAQLMAPLLLASLFIERALEVFLSGSRGARTNELKRPYEVASEKFEAAKTAAAAGQGDPPDPRERDECEAPLAEYKQETQRWAWVGGMVLGIAVAAMGLRALGLFVDPGEFEDLREWQRSWFHTLDILLTGAVLAGGSEGLHHLIEVFVKYLKKNANS